MSFTNVLTVTQVNTYLKAVLEENPVLRSLYISGEISNFTNHYRTGHLYFTLKDEGALIKCVMFKSSAARLRFLPENGMRVIVHGRISVYERDGQYQLYADGIQPDGTGTLYLAYEQLKRKLEERGWFDESAKKTIPRYPARIGVVTSPTGAAVQDIFNILGRRYPLADIVFCPVQVQGENARSEITDALYRLNQLSACDVIILGRGGGSIEDLWAFNEEDVAKAVFESKIPVISAVGHETDFTICDFVSDLRAPTPSAAAEIAVPDAKEQIAMIYALQIRMNRIIQARIDTERAKLQEFSVRRVMRSPLSLLDQRRIMLDYLINTSITAITNIFKEKQTQFRLLCSKLNMLSPLQVLSRGYAIAMQDDSVLKSINDVKDKSLLSVRLTDGMLDCMVKRKRKLDGDGKNEEADI